MPTAKKPEVIEKTAPKEVINRLVQAQMEVAHLEGHYQQAISKSDALLMTTTQMLGFDNPNEWTFNFDKEKKTITGTKLS